MNVWITLMLVSGGLFAGGVVTIAWSHAAAWRTMPVPAFVTDFARTIRIADKVQPAMLIASIAGTAGVVLTTEGTARIAGAISLICLVATLGASAALLVPLQRRIIRLAQDDRSDITSLRLRWIRGHLGRSALAVASFAAAAVASVS